MVSHPLVEPLAGPWARVPGLTTVPGQHDGEPPQLQPLRQQQQLLQVFPASKPLKRLLQAGRQAASCRQPLKHQHAYWAAPSQAGTAAATWTPVHTCHSWMSAALL